MRKVYLANEVDEVLSSFLLRQGYDLIAPLNTQAEIENILPEIEGLVISNNLKVTSNIIDLSPRLKWIARLGSGMEIVDMAYAAKKGIACISSPEGNSNAVAEHALGLLLTLTNNIIRSNREVLTNQWIREANRGIEIEGRVMGIVGLGNTGWAFAQKLLALGMKVLAYDIEPKNITRNNFEQVAQLDRLFEDAEFISFHVPLNESTQDYFNDNFVGQMKRPFYLINTSRGAVVNPQTLVNGIESGKILGAGIDVWPQEPPVWGSKEFINLQHSHNIVFTPHIAGYSIEAKTKMALSLIGKLKALLGAEL